jgi:hypothetical protein
MSILSACCACGTKPNGAVTLAPSKLGVGVKADPPWRIRNAAINDLGLPGPVAVLICSDVCEERYRNAVGFV